MAAPTRLYGKAAGVSMTEDPHLGVRFTAVQFSLGDSQAHFAKSMTCSCFLQHLRRIQLCRSCRQMSGASASSCCHLLGDDHTQLSEKEPDRALGTNPALQLINVRLVASALLFSSHAPDHHQLLMLREFFSRIR